MFYPHIRRLTITRFRGFRSLNWYPAPGLNLILGGGDVGKSTILEAIALLLHPTNGFTLSDSDYWQRRVEAEFLIEAVMHLPEGTGINQARPTAWPWEWNGEGAALPELEGPTSTNPPVYVVRVRGTADLDLVYEIDQPDRTAISFTTSLRRNIGVVKLTGDERSDRDLRLVQGGALDRYLSDRGLRSKLGYTIGQASVEDTLSAETKEKMGQLDLSFKEALLPTRLGLGFVSAAGSSVNALMGLMARKEEVNLPVLTWGSGTRRLAALKIADSLQSGMPITVIDEVERGLEPYRQRGLVLSIAQRSGQSFVTTHSASVINAATGAALWYVNALGSIGSLPGEKIAAQQAKDPEVFLARLAIVAEGITEVGFINVLLGRSLSKDWEDFGIRITDAGGNENVLMLLEALLSGGVRFAGFADHEPASARTGRWKAVERGLGDLLLRWQDGCLEKNVLPLFMHANLLSLIEDPNGEKTGMRLRTLADRLGIPDSSYEAVLNRCGDTERMLALITEAAVGHVPLAIQDDKQTSKSYKAHSRVWFKSLEGGKELAVKFFDLEDWGTVGSQLEKFVSALKGELGMPGHQETPSGRAVG